MKTFIKIFTFAIFACFSVFNITLADGMMIPPVDYYIQETGQKAVIFHENNIETMVISVSFRGDAKDFAWVVPTPSKPSVDKSSDQLFDSLEDLTLDYRYPVYESERGIPMAADKSGVDIVETKKIDYYDVTVLTSDDRDELVDWLNDNDYAFPKSERYILNDYVDNGWYFVAMKIDAASLDSERVEQELYSGQATPIKLVFESKNIIYPLKISGVQVADNYEKRIPSELPVPMPVDEQADTFETGMIADDEVEDIDIEMSVESIAKLEYEPYYYPDGMNITLYIIADHKKEVTGFYPEYADWVKKDDIESWASDVFGNPWIEPTEKKYFLTKVSTYMVTSEMTADVFPKDANNNRSLGAGTVNFETIIKFVIFLLIFIAVFGGIIIFSPFGVGFIICSIIQFLSKSKKAHKICWGFQIFILIASVFLFLTAIAIDLFGFYALRNLFNDTYVQEEAIIVLATLIASVSAIALMIITMIFQSRHHKKHVKKLK